MHTVKVMVNGIPGNVAVLMAKHIVSDDRFDLIPYSLTGPEITEKEVELKKCNVTLIRPETREEALNKIKEKFSPFICIDYTHPSAVNVNAEFYCQKGLPFVMGTTGGDRKALTDTVKTSTISAVIAPNMAKQIVGFQAMMEYAAHNFPDLFKGYSLELRESHQHGKADTSGTAKAMIGYFNSLGIPFTPEEIVMERDPETQNKRWGIPEEYLSGHAWHTYSLVSDDKTVCFEFTHNVNGREVYARGTLDAVLFLKAKISQGTSGEVFTMIDVLKGI